MGNLLTKVEAYYVEGGLVAAADVRHRTLLRLERDIRVLNSRGLSSLVGYPDLRKGLIRNLTILDELIALGEKGLEDEAGQVGSSTDTEERNDA